MRGKFFILLILNIKILFSMINVAEIGDEIIVENDRIKLVISPKRGGIISSFYYKEWKNNKIKDIIPGKKKYMGLFMDHLWGQTWPGELLEVPYDIVSIDKKNDYFSILLKREISGIWQGVEQEIIKGLILEKKYVIKKDSEIIWCYIKLINNTEKSKLPAYWLQNVFFIGGDYDSENDIFFRPSLRGIRKSVREKGEKDFLKDPYTGWSGAIDIEKKEGIIFLMDYNYLDMLYNCGGNTTLEFMFDKIPIPPGKFWETEIVMIPFTGIDYISHCSLDILSGINIYRENGKIEIKHLIKGVSKDIKNLELNTEVLNPIENKKISLPIFKIDKINSDEFKEIIQKENINFPDPLVISVKIKGDNISEKYFDFYTGSYGYGDNIQQDMVTPVFKVEKIAKKQRIMKPEKIERIYDGKIDIFFMKGLLSENYKIENVIEKMKNKFNVSCEYGYYSIGLEGPRITYFPFDYNEIMSKDIIIVGNVNIESLGNIGIEILKDYIENGGNIIFLGGKVSYGAGGLKNSILYDILPIEISSSFSDIEFDKNSYLVFKNEFLNEIRIRKKLFCPYIHKVKAKPNSKILIKTNRDFPFLIYKELDKGGKIFCITGAPFEYDNLNVFFESSEWEKILEKVFLGIFKNGK
ncbi:MAG: hypothetical protein NC899_08680 [Candidatus Omnitrophica bacterium]|nr:hypothetical protein [Candidatus Omnitrophota bacterium]